MRGQFEKEQDELQSDGLRVLAAERGYDQAGAIISSSSDQKGAGTLYLTVVTESEEASTITLSRSAFEKLAKAVMQEVWL